MEASRGRLVPTSCLNSSVLPLVTIVNEPGFNNTFRGMSQKIPWAKWDCTDRRGNATAGAPDRALGKWAHVPIVGSRGRSEALRDPGRSVLVLRWENEPAGRQ